MQELTVHTPRSFLNLISSTGQVWAEPGEGT